MTEDEPFEERVRGQPVRPVEARARGLADGPEPRDGGASLEVGRDAAAQVVRRGHDGDWLLGDVEAESKTLRVDVREVSLRGLRALVRDVEHHVVGARRLHLEVDGAGDDVARREVGERVNGLHEGRPVAGAPEDSPLPPHGLADEEVLGLGMEQAGRVELVKFHVRDLRARAVRHRDAVPGRDVRVGRVEVDLPCPAAREHGGAREDGLDDAGADVEDVRTGADLGPAVLRERDEVDGHVLLEDLNVLGGPDSFEHGALDLAARGVGRVRDAPGRVPAFEVKIEGRLVTVEARAELLEHRDARGGVLDAELDDPLVAKAGPGLEGVLDVGLEGVRLAQHGGNAALRVLGVGLVGRALGDDDDGAELLRLEREGQACDPAPDDEEVADEGHPAVLGPRP